jgi:lysophospholipase L1-like esterase
MPNFAFWLTLPWVLPQAVWVRRHTPRFRAPSGELRGRFGDHPTQRIIGVGDSIIAGVGAQEAEETITSQLALHWHKTTGAALEWMAYGKIGARSARVRSLVESLASDDRVALVLISAGVNDITGLTPTHRWLADMDAVVVSLQQRFPKSRLALLGIPSLDVFPALPSPLRQVLGWRAAHYDRAARHYCDSNPAVCYVPIDSRPQPDEFSSDGFHPSVASYATIARDIVRICRRDDLLETRVQKY